jgi:hypothetical protein
MQRGNSGRCRATVAFAAEPPTDAPPRPTSIARHGGVLLGFMIGARALVGAAAAWFAAA